MCRRPNVVYVRTPTASRVSNPSRTHTNQITTPVTQIATNVRTSKLHWTPNGDVHAMAGASSAQLAGSAPARGSG